MTKRTSNAAVANEIANDYKDESNDVAASNTSPDINLQDLQLMKQIIDLCSSRAVFKPSEMLAVGTVYNKLEAFLQAVAEQQKATEGDK